MHFGSGLGRPRIVWFSVGVTVGCLATGAVWLMALDSQVDPREPVELVPDRPAEISGVSASVESFLGVLLARQTVDVASEIDSQLQQIDVRVGDVVDRGQRLGRMDTRKLRAQLEIERASLRAAKAEKQQRLLEVGKTEREDARRQELLSLFSKEEVAATRFRYEAAIASLEGASAKVEENEARVSRLEADLERSEIVAPFAGTIAARYCDPGTLLESGDLIVRIISSKDLLVRFAVPPEDIKKLRLGSGLKIHLSEPPMELRGQVYKVAPELDLAARAIFVEASVELPAQASENLSSGAEVSVTVL